MSDEHTTDLREDSDESLPNAVEDTQVLPVLSDETPHPAASPDSDEPAAESGAEPATEPPAEPAAEHGAESAADHPAEPAAESGAEPSPEPAPEPPAESAAEPPAEPGPEPATVSAGSRVILIVSRGPSPAPPSVPVGMPDVLGERQGTALLKFQDLGFAAEVLHDHHDRLPRGFVIGQYPTPGAGVLPGANAVLLVSSGRAQLPAPDVMLPSVIGLHQTLATEKLSSAGLIPRVVYDHDPVAVPGLVLSQIPSEESLAVPLRKRGGKGWLVAVAVLVLIALAAGAVWFVNRPTAIPNLIGLSQAQAEQSVRLAGFELGSVSTSQTANEKDIGTVVGQAPSPGGTAAHGSPITLVVAGGQLLTAVPNIVGMAQADGMKSLQDAGLAFSASQSYSSTVPSGSVVSQAPVSGQKVPPGTTVGLVVSSGVRTVTVPGVVGQVNLSAETALKSSGLGIATASNYDSATPASQVMGQQPTMGTGVVPGTIVGITVSKGVPPLGMAVSTVPLVVGKSASKAKSALKTAQLKYLVVKRAGTARPKNEVVAQLPERGILPRNSVVIVFVSDGS